MKNDEIYPLFPIIQQIKVVSLDNRVKLPDCTLTGLTISQF